MQSIKIVVFASITHYFALSVSAQIPAMSDTMENLEDRQFDDHFKLLGLKRRDVDGFMLYLNKDTLPQDIFLIPYSANIYNQNKTMEENFLEAISQPNLIAFEEVFISMRWTMPTLEEELKKCIPLIVDSDYPPVFGGWPLRVIYGRIIYRIYFDQEKRIIAPPMVTSITIKHKMKEYKIPIGKSEYGNARFFKAIK